MSFIRPWLLGNSQLSSVDGPLTGNGINCMAAVSCGQQHSVQVEIGDEWCSSGLSVGTGVI